MQFAAVIFDLDGTVVDSEPLHKRAEIDTFRRLGYEIEERDLLPMTGTTLPHMLSCLTPGVTPEQFLAVQMPLFTEMIRTELELFDDAVRLIQRLAVPIALATSSMPWYLATVTEKFPLLHSAFPIRLCAADVEHGKPDPEIFLKTCARLGIAPGRTAVIEDSRNGVLAAKAAGCAAIGIDRHGKIDLSEADLVVQSLDALF